MSTTFTSPTLDDLIVDLIDGRSVVPLAAGGCSGQLDRDLIVAATVVRAELGIVRGLCGESGQHQRLVAGMFDLALSYEVCEAGAVGVVGTIVEAVGTGHERDVALALTRATSSFDGPSLLAGAAALTAAVTSYLADLAALDPLAVYDEVRQAVPEPITVTRRSRCRTHGNLA